jgi:hypothetical protein
MRETRENMNAKKRHRDADAYCALRQSWISIFIASSNTKQLRVERQEGRVMFLDHFILDWDVFHGKQPPVYPGYFH